MKVSDEELVTLSEGRAVGDDLVEFRRGFENGVADAEAHRGPEPYVYEDFDIAYNDGYIKGYQRAESA